VGPHADAPRVDDGREERLTVADGGRLRRFLHLERPRVARDGAAPEAPPSPGAAERFAQVERPGMKAPAAGRPTGARLERFGPEPEPSIELVDTESDARPFTRCMRCGMDHGVFATECTHCGASLDTEAQRAFNERLWAERREQAAREARALAERRVLEDRAAEEDCRAARARAEALAREVGDAERRRLDREAWREGPWTDRGGWTGGTPEWLLSLARRPWLATAVLGGAAALALFAKAGGRAAALLPILVLVVLLSPRRGRW
jgi:hypothetical protein